MGILFTILLGIPFTITMGFLFTMILGIQLTISNLLKGVTVDHLDQVWCSDISAP